MAARVSVSSGAASAAAKKLEAKRKMLANFWMCTCKPAKGNSGRAWHAAQCKRQIFENAGGKAGGATQPIIGEIVEMLQCAGQRAGKKYQCIRVQYGGWKEISP